MEKQEKLVSYQISNEGKYAKICATHFNIGQGRGQV